MDTAAGMYVGHYMAWNSAVSNYYMRFIYGSEAQALLSHGEAPTVAPDL